MKVQELIDLLNKVEDKNKPVFLSDDEDVDEVPISCYTKVREITCVKADEDGNTYFDITTKEADDVEVRVVILYQVEK